MEEKLESIKKLFEFQIKYDLGMQKLLMSYVLDITMLCSEIGIVRVPKSR